MLRFFSILTMGFFTVMCFDPVALVLFFLSTRLCLILSWHYLCRLS